MADQDPKIDAPIQDQNLYQAFRRLKAKDYDGAEQLIKDGIKIARDSQDTNLEGVYLSAMGLMYKLRSDYKKAYKVYQQAEKFLKDDHSLKIISAVLLIEQFKQYETAVRKLSKVVAEANDPALVHHAKSLQALALFYMKKNKEAEEMFIDVVRSDFTVLRSAANVEFKAVEAFCSKGVFKDLCSAFLQKALDLAKRNNEKGYISAIQKLLPLVK